MLLPVSEKLNKLAGACAFPLYVVGGTVRDFLAGLVSEKKDTDICAPASAEEFCAAAVSCGAVIESVYKNTGTVKLSLDGEEYEFASFRSDEYVRGVHTPVKSFFTDDMALDARRRDFKCNAVYYDIKNKKFADPLGGIRDIENRRMNTVACADKVFGEDGLRLMRLARISAQTGFVPSEECLDGAKRNAALVADISAERIFSELEAILTADLKYGRKYAQYEGLKILDKIRVLDVIVPELTLGRGMEQNPSFHRHDVLEHTLRTVKYADAGIRLAALLHDCGKPYCMRENGNYHAHEVEGARIAEDICTRLKVSKKLKIQTVELTRLHMYDLRCDARESKIRRLIVRNYGLMEKLLLLKQADYSACRDDLSQAPCVTKWRKILSDMKREGAPFTIKQLNVRGDELISAGIAPADAGKILSGLLEECAIQPALNKKQLLIRRAFSLADE